MPYLFLRDAHSLLRWIVLIVTMTMLQLWGVRLGMTYLSHQAPPAELASTWPTQPVPERWPPVTRIGRGRSRSTSMLRCYPTDARPPRGNPNPLPATKKRGRVVT